MLLANTAVANIRSVSVLRGLTTSAGDRPGEASSEHDVAGTLAVATDGHDVQQTGLEAPPPPQSTRKPRRRHLVLDVSIIVGVGVVYFLSLLGYHWLATAPGPLPEPDRGHR